MMIGKLVALIEDHADELTARMVRLVRENPATEGYHRVGDEELGERTVDGIHIRVVETGTNDRRFQIVVVMFPISLCGRWRTSAGRA